MNQSFDQPDDHQLREQLRIVKLPAGLASRLKAIPELDQARVDAGLIKIEPEALADNATSTFYPDPGESAGASSSKESARNRKRYVSSPIRVAVGLAAALLLLILTWQLWRPDQLPPSIALGGEQAVPAGHAGSLSYELEALEREADAMRQVIAELELAELRRKRDQLLAAIPPNPASWLSPRESVSLALALSCRAAHEMGVPASDLASDLDRLEGGFEGTSGAQLARQLRAEFGTQ